MDQTDEAPGRARSLASVQRLSLGLLVLTGVLNYMDRSALSVANSAISADLHLSATEMGFLLSAFSWSYAVAQLPMGGMVDRYRPRILLTIGIFLWSVAQGLCGLVSSLKTFVAARILLGIGESPQYPTAAKVVSDWFPMRSRGFPTGVFNAASPLGTALAPPLLSLILVAHGWRSVFLILGVVGVVIAGIWWAGYRNPGEVNLSAADRETIRPPQAPAATRDSFKAWRGLFRHGATWGMILGFFGSVYLNWVYLTWLPRYLQTERHMDTIKSGFAAFFPFFFGFVGCLVAGWMSDQLVRMTGSTIKGRKYLAVAAMFGMALFTIPAAFIQDNLLALVCISIVIFLANVASTASWALVSAVAPHSQVASLGAIQNFGGYIGASLAPIITGFLYETTGHFITAMLTGAAICSVSAVIYIFGVRRAIPAAA